MPAELICTPLAAAAFRHRARVYGLVACWVRQHILWPWRPAGGCKAAVTGTSCKDDEKAIELVICSSGPQPRRPPVATKCERQNL